MNELGKNPYVHTWCGHRFYFLDPDPDTVCIEDIAHSLSLQCRFNGHTTEFYSVAQPSLIVADIVRRETDDPRLALTGLLHDAPEAYLGDVVSPLKCLLPGYKKFEQVVEKCIADRFSLPHPFPKVIHTADVEALKGEFNSLAPFAHDPPAQQLREPWQVEHEFINRYKQLVQEIKDG